VEPINLQPNTLQKKAYYDHRQMLEMHSVIVGRIFIQNTDYIIIEWGGGCKNNLHQNTMW
jgi:hypothetical protein